MTYRNALFLLALAVLCAGCAAHPGPIAVGVAGSLAVIDQLLADGVVAPEQAYALRNGIDALQQSVEAVKAAQSGTLTEGEAAVAAGGLTAGILGIIKAWRGPATKAVAKAVAPEVQA